MRIPKARIGKTEKSAAVHRFVGMLHNAFHIKKSFAHGKFTPKQGDVGKKRSEEDSL